MMGLEESFQNHPTIQVNFDIQHNSARLMGLCLDSLSSISSLRDYVEAVFWMDGLLFRDISVYTLMKPCIYIYMSCSCVFVCTMIIAHTCILPSGND